MPEIQFPLIQFRPYQIEAWNAIMHGIDTVPRFKAMTVWHRRAGKDLFYLQVLVARALSKVGNYWYALPETQQAKNAIWEGITRDGLRYLDTIPAQAIKNRDNHAMKIYFKNGSIISMLGGDRVDQRVGAGLQGIVISEYALQKPSFYDLAIEPMLKETKGFALLNTTPRGDNHAKTMFDFLTEEAGYFTSFKTIRDTTDIDGTPIVTEADLDEERRRGKMEELIQQEYYCSWTGAQVGSYYGDLLNMYKENVGSWEYDAGVPVHTLWDLGVSDSTAIWFVQFVGNSIHCIDYYENTGYGLSHYVRLLKEKDYHYAQHHIPWDGHQRQMTSDERALTIENQLKKLDLRPIKVHERRANVYEQIQRVRGLLPRVKFDAVKTKDGLDALREYRREYDEGRMRFKDTPYHNWASHGADAFSMLAVVDIRAGVDRTKLKVSKKWSGKFF